MDLLTALASSQEKDICGGKKMVLLTAAPKEGKISVSDFYFKAFRAPNTFMEGDRAGDTGE